MSLRYLIDGYNLLYALPVMPQGNWEDKRTTLLDTLLTQQPYGKNKCSIVFDSRQGTGERTAHGVLEVIFTAGETADDWIIHHVRDAANPRTLVVVTDDQSLRRMIRGTGAKWLPTEEFMKRSKMATPPPMNERTYDTTITEELKKKWL